MFSTLSGVMIAANIHFEEAKYKHFKKNNQEISETLYKNKVDRQDEKEKYKKSKLPESGYMTVDEYEAKSAPKSRREISSELLNKAEFPKDEHMVYVPQYKFKLIKYNEPVGSPELSLPRRLNFDRQINAQGIVSGNYKMLVYPAVYYYAESDCTSCDLFLINLDPKLPNLEKVEKANVVNKEKNPLISTSKDIDEKHIFRTLTPVDFSADNNKLAVKEKIGYRHDGIWKTELWVYDFDNKQAAKLPQIRESILNYWKDCMGLDLREKRWDIYPLGFDGSDDNRIVVSAYAYTGENPKFLGNWSIDISGNSPKLESLTESNQSISVVGYRLVRKEDPTPLYELEYNAKQAKKESKAEKKKAKAQIKAEHKKKKQEYKQRVKKMNEQTLEKVKQLQGTKN